MSSRCCGTLTVTTTRSTSSQRASSSALLKVRVPRTSRRPHAQTRYCWRSGPATRIRRPRPRPAHGRWQPIRRSRSDPQHRRESAPDEGKWTSCVHPAGSRFACSLTVKPYPALPMPPPKRPTAMWDTALRVTRSQSPSRLSARSVGSAPHPHIYSVPSRSARRAHRMGAGQGWGVVAGRGHRPVHGGAERVEVRIRRAMRPSVSMPGKALASQ